MTPEEHAYLLILAAKVDELMATHALNQAQLAKRMHTDRATVCRLLQGQDARLSTYLKAITALDAEIIIRKRCA